MSAARTGVVRVVVGVKSSSGFIVDADGHILTNAHVVRGLPAITVLLDDGTELSAQPLAWDLERDVALLKIDAEGLTLNPLSFADSALEGEYAMALGYPRWSDGSLTVSEGVVSSLPDSEDEGGHIRTDAAINPGNSGGPLLNRRGEVIGMNARAERDFRGMELEGAGLAIQSSDLSASLAAMRAGDFPLPTPAPASALPAAFGPADGSLSDSDGIATFSSRVNLADFVAETTFVGDLPIVWMPMRIDDDLENYHIVTLDKTGGTTLRWSHARKREGESPQRIQEGDVASAIATGADARNHVRVIAYGDVGLLFINGEFEAELDFGSVADAGDVDLYAFGEEDSSATSGREPVSVRFEEFVVRPLSVVYGPKSGEIEHKDNGGIDLINSVTSMSNGIIEATFFNPYPTREGSWSVGFLFRYPRFNEFHAVIVRSNSKRYHYLRAGGNADSYQNLNEEYSERISTSAEGNNSVRVVAMGDDGWLFINGKFIANLDLSGGAKFGEVMIVGQYFGVDLIPGRFTRFADFTIHSVSR